MWRKLLFLFVLLGIGACFILTHRDPLMRKLSHGERVNAVVIGCDEVKGARHADAILFLSYDPHREFMDIMTLPRDTLIPGSPRAHTRLAEIFALAFKQRSSLHDGGRAVSVALSSSSMLGVNIPFYAVLDYVSFRKIVDLAGGVEVDIVEPMHYDDSWGKLHIHFSTGHYRLAGSATLEYVRYRSSQGDVGRISRQQSLIRNLARKLASPRAGFALLRHPGEYASLFKTNMSLFGMLTALYEFKHWDQSRMRFQSLPGKPHPRGWWLMQPEKVLRAMTLITLGKILEVQKSYPSEAILVEIFNASGKPRLAERLRRKIHGKGFDVVKVGNYGREAHRDKTVVVDRTGNLDKAMAVAKQIGVSDVLTAIDPSRQVDVTVILGKDMMIEKEGYSP